MNRYALALGLFSALAIASSPVAASDGADLSGSWSYTRTAGSVSGMCSAGRPASGLISITQQGSKVALDIESGSTCKPASVCKFAGKLEGKNLSVTNAASVDDEGGKVANSMRLVVISDGSMKGSSSSKYTHPGGFACTWQSQITLSRRGGGEATSPSGTAGGSASTGRDVTDTGVAPPDTAADASQTGQSSGSSSTSGGEALSPGDSGGTDASGGPQTGSASSDSSSGDTGDLGETTATEGGAETGSSSSSSTGGDGSATGDTQTGSGSGTQTGGG